MVCSSLSHCSLVTWTEYMACGGVSPAPVCLSSILFYTPLFTFYGLFIFLLLLQGSWNILFCWLNWKLFSEKKTATIQGCFHLGTKMNIWVKLSLSYFSHCLCIFNVLVWFIWTFHCLKYCFCRICSTLIHPVYPGPMIFDRLERLIFKRGVSWLCYEMGHNFCLISARVCQLDRMRQVDILLTSLW